MPPPPLLTALKTAALSQVDVRIIIPDKSDVVTPRWSTFSYVEELLEAGIKIYFYRNGFIHSKLMIVDDTFSTIGTTNFDFRSFETNFEVNAFIYNKEFTNKLEGYFIEDLSKSREIKLKEWMQRPWHFKFRESLAHIIAPMM
jgi:cardiolipin synthase